MSTASIHDDIEGGLDKLPPFGDPGAIDALFRGALHREGEAAVQFAALLLYLHGVAKHPFAWEHRELSVRFHTLNRTEREAAFRELCAMVRVDANKYVRPRRMSWSSPAPH